MSGENDDSCEIGSLDEQALLRVAFKFKQALGVFETTSDEAPQGYLFSWGHIEERRIENWVIWDFHFHDFRRHDPSTDLQGKRFGELVQCLGCVFRESIDVPCSAIGWSIAPGEGLGAFSVMTHFCHEEAARRWIAATLIPAILPYLIERVEIHAKPGLP